MFSNKKLITFISINHQKIRHNNSTCFFKKTSTTIYYTYPSDLHHFGESISRRTKSERLINLQK